MLKSHKANKKKKYTVVLPYETIHVAVADTYAGAARSIQEHSGVSSCVEVAGN
jgi:hypothetical protein